MEGTAVTTYLAGQSGLQQHRFQPPRVTWLHRDASPPLLVVTSDTEGQLQESRVPELACANWASDSELRRQSDIWNLLRQVPAGANIFAQSPEIVAGLEAFVDTRRVEKHTDRIFGKCSGRPHVLGRKLPIGKIVALQFDVYSAHARTRKSPGEMIRKLSVTSSQ